MPPHSYLNSNGSQFNLDCTNFTVDVFKHLNRLNTGIAFVCSVIALVILIHLICSKAFSSLLKRLYFYLIAATLFNVTIMALNIEHQWQYRGQDEVCKWLGFFANFSYVLVFTFSCEVIVHLVCLVVSQVRGSQPFPRCTGSRYYTITLEIAYIVFPLMISATLALPPYVNGLYGIAGPWCWVQSLDEDCKPTGLETQIIFFSMKTTVAIVEIAVSVVFLVMYSKISALSRDARFLLKQTLYVMLFQIINVLMIVYNLSVRLHTLFTHRHQSYGLWVVGSLVGPVSVQVLPLGYWLFFYPVKSNILKGIHKITKCCKRKSSSSSWLVETLNVTKFATAPRSDRISQPSYTYYVVSHPDDFSETAPLTVSDTGYDSTMTSHTSRQK